MFKYYFVYINVTILCVVVYNYLSRTSSKNMVYTIIVNINQNITLKMFVINLIIISRIAQSKG